MRCPNCSINIADRATSHADCGWRVGNSNRSEVDRRNSEFESLPPCFHCAGTGITLTLAGTRYTSCDCQRGRWMRENGTIFREGVTSVEATSIDHHPDIVARVREYFPLVAGITVAQRRARLKKAKIASWPTAPSRRELRLVRNKQVDATLQKDQDKKP